jgi:predicted DNA-binding transcriptional regulator AlpA
MTINALRHADVTNGIQNRLGLRLGEFSRATGMSLPTIYRRIRAGDIRITYIGGMPLITQPELVRLGLIARDNAAA